MASRGRIILAFSIASLTALASPGTARAQEQPELWAAAIQTSCARELRSYCSGIAPGEGRMLACLYARENRLSPRCSRILAESVGQFTLQGTTPTYAYDITRDCDSDVRRLCTGVEGGRGNIISCLSLARPSLSPRCNAALDAASLR